MNTQKQGTIKIPHDLHVKIETDKHTENETKTLTNIKVVKPRSLA